VLQLEKILLVYVEGFTESLLADCHQVSPLYDENRRK